MGLKEIEMMAVAVRGHIDKIYLHWSAGHYDTVFDDYHINIKGDGEIVVTGGFGETKAHTFKRNTGAIGVSLCCCFDATSNDLGSAPPTKEQIEKMAQVIAHLAKGLDIPIDKQHILTHGEAANNEDGLTPHKCYAWWNDECGDGDTRGDLEFLGIPESPVYNPYATDGTRGGDVLRGKANWYLNEMNGIEQTQSENLQTQNEELPEVRIWNFFKSKNLNDYAVAGIMGNLYAESGLISNNLQNSYEYLGSDEGYTAKVDSGEYSKDDFINDGAGYGLAQWTYWTRKAALYDYAKLKGASIGDLDMQLEFLWGELSEYGGLMSELENATSVREASDAFLLDFERPADQGEGQRARRAGYSQNFYDKLAGKVTEERNEMRYNTLDEVPDWAKGTIGRMIEQGVLKGDGTNLDLSRDMIRVYVAVERWMRR